MGDKRIEIVTESMFYTLMAFTQGECSGADAAAFTDRLTEGRVHLGPATLYTILGRFEKECVIEEVRTEGRKRIYRLTKKGAAMYQGEQERLAICLKDANSLLKGDA